MIPDDRRIIRFGRFELDDDKRELRKDGRPIPLAPQPLKLLALLARRAGGVLTRDEIRNALWAGDTFVNFDQAVNSSIRQIRDALGDQSERPLYIQTVPKSGYRFIAPLEPLSSETADAFESYRPAEALQRVLWENIVELRLAQRRTNWQTAILAVLLVSLALVFLVRSC